MATITSAKEQRTMKSKLDGLTDRTRADYMSLAEHFYAERLEGQPPSPKRIRDALRAASLEYRPAYWRKLRNAVMYSQIAAGYYDTAAEVKEVYNPVMSPKTGVDRKMRESVGGKPGTQQKRLKKLPDADYVKLFREITKRKDIEVGSAVKLAEILGCRPAEMLNVQCLDNGVVFVEGAKKTEKGDRGLDRYLQVTPEEWEVVKHAVTALKAVDPGKAGTMRKIQDRLDTITSAVWPRRKTKPTLYTLRYSMGSELKASGLSKREVAYIMGHQSMQSVDKYGDRRSGSGKTPIKPAPGADMSQVREGYKENAMALNQKPKGGGGWTDGGGGMGIK